MPKRFALIDRETNTVQNVIMLADASEWTDENFYVVQSDTANIGDTYQYGEFAPHE